MRGRFRWGAVGDGAAMQIGRERRSVDLSVNTRCELLD